nr:unnamed protein product [Callosobruchus chinensis]
MDNLNGHVMTLANSIIGVSILAMPYCFKQCGIMLSILMLFVSSIISRLSCHFLLKSAIIARRKTFEFLAFHIFGSAGKFAIEIGIIGFLLGTCIAFFVVMGELGPQIVVEITNISTTSTMRTSILMALALFVVLPLGLLRNVDSFNGVSKATIGFYCCLVLKVVFEAVPHILTGDWYQNVNFWRPQGLMQCLPIFSMALFCQTQLFEMYQAINNATLERMNNLVKVAMTLCTSVYIFVGTFGYIAFADKNITGNILLSFSPSFITNLLKLGFILSIAFSFPLIIFPCRASLYSLLYKEGYTLHEGTSNYIPEGRFKTLTMLIIFFSLVVGIMIPNIELVLGLVGSTISIMICLLFPLTCFICISQKNTNERLVAQLMLFVGIFIMVLGTYETLYTVDTVEVNKIGTFSSIDTIDHIANVKKDIIQTHTVLPSEKPITMKKLEVKTENLPKMTEKVKEVRHEPPQPVEPSDEEIKMKNGIKLLPTPKNVAQNDSKLEQVDIEAIKKEDKEEKDAKLEAKMDIKTDTNKALLDTIQKQNEVQKELVENQKKILEVIQSQQKKDESRNVEKLNEEKVKAVKQIQDIAQKAIEKISGGDKNLVGKESGGVEKKTENVNILNDHMEKNDNIELNVKPNILEELKKIDTTQKSPEQKNEPVVNAVNIQEQAKKIQQVIEVIQKHNIDVNQLVMYTKPIDMESNNIAPKKENIVATNEKITVKILKSPSDNVDNTRTTISNISIKRLLDPANYKQNKNNTAPLFMNLGKKANREDKQKQIPIPLPISMKNITLPKEASSLLKISGIKEDKKNSEVAAIPEEVAVVRRDILQFISRK